eukprot:4530226-Amphidinium_carterae.1
MPHAWSQDALPPGGLSHKLDKDLIRLAQVLTIWLQQSAKSWPSHIMGACPKSQALLGLVTLPSAGFTRDSAVQDVMVITLVATIGAQRLKHIAGKHAMV